MQICTWYTPLFNNKPIQLRATVEDWVFSLAPDKMKYCGRNKNRKVLFDKILEIEECNEIFRTPFCRAIDEEDYYPKQRVIVFSKDENPWYL